MPIVAENIKTNLRFQYLLDKNKINPDTAPKGSIGVYVKKSIPDFFSPILLSWSGRRSLLSKPNPSSCSKEYLC